MVINSHHLLIIELNFTIMNVYYMYMVEIFYNDVMQWIFSYLHLQYCPIGILKLAMTQNRSQGVK